MGSNRKKSTKARYKHQLIAADILDRIHGGEWTIGSKVPSIDELEGVYPYSRMTIFKALQELTKRGYLRTQRGVGTFVERDRLSGCVGLIVSEDVLHPQSTPWAFLFVRSIREYLAQYNYVLKMYIEHAPESGMEIPAEGFTEDLQRGLLAGVILVNCDAQLYLPKSRVWAQKSVPLVDITGWKDAPHHVAFDYQEMIRLGLEHCRRHSRRRIAAIGVDGLDYLAAQAKKLGLETRPPWIVIATVGPDAEKNGYEAMMGLWQHRERPDALLILDDVVAKGVLHAATALGIAIPGELLVLTHANRGSGIFYPAEVVRIEFDIAECGRIAGELLRDLIRNPALPPRTAVLRPKLNTASAADRPPRPGVTGETDRRKATP